MENDMEDPSNTISGNAANRQGKVPDGMKIVGYNILVLVVYTVLCKFSSDLGGLVAEAFLIGIHVLVCIVMAIIKRSGIWLLAGILVLIIGFSTCIYVGNWNLMS
jgi:hypothetical protein